MNEAQALLPDEVDVVVVGCGPVGALTANLLGLRGIRTLVIERSTAAHGQPRAFSCDDEALRIYQQAGLLEPLIKDMYASPLVEYVNGRGRPFAQIALSEVDFGLGQKPLHFFDQPRLEATLRAGLDRFDHVTLRLGAEVVGLDQSPGGVALRVRDVATGQDRDVRARYVLGCDGARSSTRTLAGIDLVGSTYSEPWLAVSGDIPPDGIRMSHTWFVCDWRRPAFISPATHGSYRLEFMLRPGETASDMETPERIAELVQPYVDPARFEVRRAAVYTFHNLIAERWRAQRVFLLGDAAHQMPPFMGQGLCSGLRDAANLTWKLGLVLTGAAAPAVLDSYEVERRAHTEEMAKVTVQMGRIFLARNRGLAWLRDNALRSIQTIPRVRRFVRRFEFKPLPRHKAGLLVSGPGAGVMFPQPRVTALAQNHPLDAVLGDGFTVLGPGVGPGLAQDPRWDGLPVRFVRVLEPAAPSAPPTSAPTSAPAAGGVDGPPDYLEVTDVDGALLSWFRRHRADVAVLRPDRFVFATASGKDIAGLPATLAAALRPTNQAMAPAA